MSQKIMKFYSNRPYVPLIVSLICIILVFANTSRAQDNLESTIRDMLVNDYPVTYIQSYMQPFATAFGSVVASGLYHRAYAKKFPHGDVGIKAIKLHIPQDDWYFSWEGEEVPTVFGPVTNDTAYVSGTGLQRITLPMYQINFGMFSGFEVMLRGNQYNFPEIGTMDFFGLSVRYGFSDIIPKIFIPIDMSVQVLYHTYSMGEWLNSGTFAMNLQTSTDLEVLPLTIYGGFGYESTSLKLSTDKISGIDTKAIGDISINGQNKLRATIGAGITIFLLNVHAEYNFGTYNSAAGGILVVF